MKSASAIFVIALYVFLPLYELVDYNEHWQNDGHFVAVIFTILFIIEIPRILRKVDSVSKTFLETVWRFALDAVPLGGSSLPACTGTSLFLRLCDFRI